MTELTKEQFWATDEPTKRDYKFDDFEAIKHADPEYAPGIVTGKQIGRAHV